MHSKIEAKKGKKSIRGKKDKLSIGANELKIRKKIDRQTNSKTDRQK